MKPRERLARLHFINTILHAITGRDLYLASAVLAGIEAAAAENTALERGPGTFSQLVDFLHEVLTGAVPDAGFTYVECASPESAGPLWVRANLEHALAAHADTPQATVVIGNAAGTDDAPLPRPGGRQSAQARRRLADYAASIDELRRFAARKASPRSLVTLLFV